MSLLNKVKISLFNASDLLVVGGCDHAIRYFDALISKHISFATLNRYRGPLALPMGRFEVSIRIFFFISDRQRVSSK